MSFFSPHNNLSPYFSDASYKPIIGHREVVSQLYPRSMTHPNYQNFGSFSLSVFVCVCACSRCAVPRHHRGTTRSDEGLSNLVPKHLQKDLCARTYPLCGGSIGSKKNVDTRNDPSTYPTLPSLVDSRYYCCHQTQVS